MLLQHLIRRQRALGLNDREFAGLLGVPRSTWMLTRAGTKPLRTRVARAVLTAFHADPVLTSLASSFLLVGDTVASSTARTVSEPRAPTSAPEPSDREPAAATH